MVGKGRAEVRVEQSPDEVWAVVGDFGRLAEWSPGIDSCTVEGQDRTIVTGGMEFVERLVHRDEATRTLVYGVLPSGVMPITRHEATVAVEPAGSGSLVSWSFEIEPDQLTDVLLGAYQQGLDALRAHLGG